MTEYTDEHARSGVAVLTDDERPFVIYDTGAERSVDLDESEK